MSDATITNCRLDGCRLDNSLAVAKSHLASGVNAMSRVAGCVTRAGAMREAAADETAGYAASPTIAAAIQRRFMPGEVYEARLTSCVRRGCLPTRT